MDSNFTFFVFILIAIIVGVFVVKKITGCLIKAIILAVIIGGLAVIYFTHFTA